MSVWKVKVKGKNRELYIVSPVNPEDKNAKELAKEEFNDFPAFEGFKHTEPDLEFVTTLPAYFGDSASKLYGVWSKVSLRHRMIELKKQAKDALYSLNDLIKNLH